MQRPQQSVHWAAPPPRAARLPRDHRAAPDLLGAADAAALRPAAAPAALPHERVRVRHDLALEAPLLGKRVRVHGLKGKAELNGSLGIADGYNSAKGRYHILLDSDPTTPVMLKPKNVVAVEDDAGKKPKLARKRSGTLHPDQLGAVRAAAAAARRAAVGACRAPRAHLAERPLLLPLHELGSLRIHRG